MLEEIAGRSGDYNLGGSTRRKLLTAYRENALRIARLLELRGPATPRALRALSTGPKTYAILYDNVYGWFQRVSQGTYAITDKGRTALVEYCELVKTF
jgi:hypothetical protein